MGARSGDPHLKIIMEGANLFHPGETGRMLFKEVNDLEVILAG